MWCSQEVKHLTLHLAKQLFMPQVTLSTLVECIVTVRSHCDQVRILEICTCVKERGLCCF